MLDIGWSEIAIVAVIAIIVIGPKDLPKVLRTLGQWIGKAKALAREFQNSVDEVIRDAELDDVKSQIDSVRHYDVKKKVADTIDPTGELEGAFDVPVDDEDAKDKKDKKAGRSDDTKAAEPQAIEHKEAASPAPAAEAGAVPRGDGGQETAAPDDGSKNKADA